jgi:small GTP-binding protein
MHVIGTAGHVDHGKTTLIEALTGINPDRLPEEKERGMTIDLGFAWFPGKDGEPVVVIDVPGHERFIRNMVAGAWSLDCALLLVAADDGWMEQTQDHAVVLQALEVPSVILVITKTDIAAPERVEEVLRDTRERCRIIFGAEPPAIEVSALAGKNLAALKELILATLAGIPEPAIPTREHGFPFLYVDRVFSIKGSGLVVTGSLRGAPLAKDDALELLPAREALRVRAVQSYNSAVDRAMPTSRVALNLQKPKSEIARGACITAPGAPFQCEKEIIARVRPIEMGQQAGEKPVIKNHSEIEVDLGTGHEIAQIHFLDDPRFARIQLRSPLPALWNQPFLLIRHGGSAILGSGRILWFGEVPKEERRRFTALLAAMPEPAREEDRFSLQLRFPGAGPARPLRPAGGGGSRGHRRAGRLDLPRTVARKAFGRHRRPRRSAGGGLRAGARRQAAPRRRRPASRPFIPRQEKLTRRPQLAVLHFRGGREEASPGSAEAARRNPRLRARGLPGRARGAFDPGAPRPRRAPRRGDLMEIRAGTRIPDITFIVFLVYGITLIIHLSMEETLVRMG